jgi:GntR family uxuAB operon transcriptional repressor
MTTPRRRYLAVAEEVLHSIAAGNLNPGDRLPDERALALRSDVSRSTVREALLALELSGVIEVRPGAGCFVTQTSSRPAPALTLNIDSVPRQMLDVRKLLEPSAARLCSQNIGESGRKQLIDIIDEAARQLAHADSDSIDRYVSCNLNFHLHIARFSGNDVLTHMTEQLIDPDRHPLWTLVDNLAGRDDANRTAQLAEHRMIMQAILDRDPDRAEEAMSSHLEAMTHRIFGADPNPVRAAHPRTPNRRRG